MNMFRIPLNIYVIITLLFISKMNPFSICILCSGLLLIASVLSLVLYFFPLKIKETSEDFSEEEDLFEDEFIPLSTFNEFTHEAFTYEKPESSYKSSYKSPMNRMKKNKILRKSDFELK